MRVCSCPNGTPTVGAGSGGTLCETSGAVDCSACDAGHSLSATAGAGAQTCLANVCSCPNGTPTVAAANSYRFYTAASVSSNACWDVMEFEFYEDSACATTKIATPSTALIQSGQASCCPIQNARDGSVTSNIFGVQPVSGQTELWFGLSTAVVARCARLYQGSTSGTNGNACRPANAVSLQVQISGTTTWTTLVTVSWSASLDTSWTSFGTFCPSCSAFIVP